jgi:hypothetical protein
MTQAITYKSEMSMRKKAITSLGKGSLGVTLRQC